MIIRSSNKQRSNRKNVFFVLESRFQMGIEPTVRNFLLFVSLFSSFFWGAYSVHSIFCFSLLQKTQISSKKNKKEKEKDVWVKWKRLTDQSRSCRLVVGPNEKWITDLSVLSHRNWLQVSELQWLSPSSSQQTKQNPAAVEEALILLFPVCWIPSVKERCSCWSSPEHHHVVVFWIKICVFFPTKICVFCCCWF